MVHNRSALTNLTNAPEVQSSTVQECNASDYSETPCSSKTQRITKVEEGGGNTADEDGELEPGEESTFGGELYFWFDTDGDVDAWTN